MPESNWLEEVPLRELERRLGATKLSPTSDQRDALLYACGRQAGMLEARHHIRRLTATAATLGVLAGAVAVASLGNYYPISQRPETRDVASVKPPGGTREFDPDTVAKEQSPATSSLISSPVHQHATDPTRLAAGMSLAAALALLDASSHPIALDTSPHEKAPHRPLRPLMRELP